MADQPSKGIARSCNLLLGNFFLSIVLQCHRQVEDRPFQYICCIAEEVADEDDDVLLLEAGNVLVDALLIKQRRFAAHTPEGD